VESNILAKRIGALEEFAGTLFGRRVIDDQLDALVSS
jgi:hypothetical protein